MGIEILSCKPARQTNIVRYKFNAIGEPRDSSINSYELSYLCKKWAYSKNYIIDSCYVNPQSEIHVYWMSKLNKRTTFNADTEPEAVFEACDWILAQVKEKR